MNTGLIRRRSIFGGIGIAMATVAGAVFEYFNSGPHYSRRLAALGLAFGVWCIAIVGRQAQLQILRGDYYFALADARRTSAALIPPLRGAITDRNGELLAVDQPSFDLSLVPGRTELKIAVLDAVSPILEADGAERDALRKELIENISAEEPLAESIARMTGCDRVALARAMEAAMERVARKQCNPKTEQVILANIDRELWQRLKELQESEYQTPALPGVTLTTSLRRRYPQGTTAAHIVGSVGLLQKEHYDSLRRSGVVLSLERIKNTWWDKQWKSEKFPPALKTLLSDALLTTDEPADILASADVLVTRLRALDDQNRRPLLDALSAAGFANAAAWFLQKDAFSLSDGERLWLDDGDSRNLTTEIVGETGVEGYYNDELRGRSGYLVRRRSEDGYFPINAVTLDDSGLNADGYAEGCELTDGKTMALTLDIRWQIAAEKALEARGLPGAIVVMDPNNGEILAMASYPAFDPNEFTPPRGNAVAEYLKDTRHPLVNRAIQGTYQQASCFKIVTSAAMFDALDLPVGYTHDCDGVEIVGKGVGGKKYCHNGYGCGPDLTVVDALSRSCNDFFFSLAKKDAGYSIQKWARDFGYGARSNVDLPGEAAGILPSPEWKRTRPGKYNRWERVWRPADACDTSIGLGAWLVTPLQSAVMVSAVANGGKIVQPHVVVDTAKNAPLRELPIRPDVLAAIRQGLYNCVNGSPKGRSYATGYKAFHDSAKPLPEGFKVAGKTGTTDTFKRWDAEKQETVETDSHAWFIGYAPADAPRVAFAAILEHGGGGGSSAAPMINEILFEMYGKKAKP